MLKRATKNLAPRETADKKMPSAPEQGVAASLYGRGPQWPAMPYAGSATC
jgi:hypothetical protein